MHVNEREIDGNVNMQGVEVMKVDEFKCIEESAGRVDTSIRGDS